MVCVGLLAGTFQTATAAYKTPPRVRVLTLDPDKNRPKPLAVYDAAGWTYFDDMIVGQVGGKWLGGRSWSKSNFVWWTQLKSPLSCPTTALAGAALACMRDGSVVKLNPFDGKIQWTASLDSFVSRQPAVSGGTIFLVTSRQKVYALDSNSGTTKWFYDAGLPEGMTIADSNPPIVHGKDLIFGLSNGRIQAVDIETGTAKWDLEIDSKSARFADVVGQILVFEDMLIAARYDGVVVAFNLSAGSRPVIWSQSFGGIGSTAFRNGRYFVGTVGGDVVALDATSGKQIWTGKTGESVKSVIALETAIFIGGNRGRVTRLRAENGSIEWHDDLLGGLSDRPVLVGDEIYFSTGMGNLYGYKVE